MATFPITLAVRLADRLTGRDQTASDAEFSIPPAPVNAALDAALAIEAGIARFVNLPIGSSVMALARKPSSGPSALQR
jgi:hypothetical protein